MALPSKSLQGNWTHGIGKSALMKRGGVGGAVYEAPVFEANEKRDEHDPFVTIRGFFVLKKQASEQEKHRIIPG